MDTRVRFSVDSSELATAFQRIKFDAEEMGRMMIQDARKYSTSSKEVLSSIEDQIKALERRNKVGFEEGKSRIETRFQSGAIDKKRYGEEILGLKRGSDEEKLQTKLLREMIETIRHTSKEEIREDRKGVEDRIRKSRTVDQLAPKGKAEEILKETLQRGTLGEIGKSEEEERMGFRQAVSKGGRGFNTLAGLATSRNEMYALAALVGLTPVIGQGLSAAAGKLLSSAERFETSRGGFSQAFGFRPSENLLGQYGSMDAYGFTYADMMERASKLNRFNTGISGRKGSGVDAALIERGFGLDIGTTGQLAKTARGSYFNLRKTFGDLTGGLMGQGASEGDVTAYLPEYFQILIDINRKQLDATHQVDSSLNAKVVSSIMSLDETLTNPELLARTQGALYQGLSTASSPQIEAMQYHVLSRIAPNKSLWELEKMRDNPWGNPDYLPAMIEQIVGISGGDEEMASRNFYSWIKGSGGNISRQGAENIIKGRKGFKSVDEIMSAGGLDIERAADRASGILAAATAATDNVFQKNGEKLVQWVKKSTELLEKFRKSEEEFEKEIKAIVQEQNEKSSARFAIETAVSLDINRINTNLAILLSRISLKNSPKP